MNPMLMWPLTLLLFLLPACGGSGTQLKPSTPTPAAATLTAAERERLVADLEQTRRAFLASVQGLSDAQVNFRPAPGRWTVAEVAEHIALSEQRLLGNVTEKVLRSPPPPELSTPGPRDDETVRKAVTDRTNRRQAPEVLRPTGRFPTLAATLMAFQSGRDQTVAFAQTTQDDLRAHGSPHPVLKLLDGYQWLLLLSAHCARHTAQIEEVKADPAFPRS